MRRPRPRALLPAQVRPARAGEARGRLPLERAGRAGERGADRALRDLLRRGPGPNWLRQLFSPTFIVWLPTRRRRSSPSSSSAAPSAATSTATRRRRRASTRSRAATAAVATRLREEATRRVAEVASPVRWPVSEGPASEQDVGVGDQRRGDHQQDRGDEDQGDDELDLRGGAGGALLDARGAGRGAGRVAWRRSWSASGEPNRRERSIAAQRVASSLPGTRSRRPAQRALEQRLAASELGDGHPQLVGQRARRRPRPISAKPGGGAAARRRRRPRAGRARRAAAPSRRRWRRRARRSSSASGTRKPAAGSPIATRIEMRPGAAGAASEAGESTCRGRPSFASRTVATGLAAPSPARASRSGRPSRSAASPRPRPVSRSTRESRPAGRETAELPPRGEEQKHRRRPPAGPRGPSSRRGSRAESGGSRRSRRAAARRRGPAAPPRRATRAAWR